MIKYNSNTINDWNIGDDNIAKVYRNNNVCYMKVASTPPQPIDYSKKYLTIVAEANNMSVSLNGSVSTVIQYSTDSGTTWSSLTTASTTSSVSQGQEIWFKASNQTVYRELGIGMLRPSAAARVEGNIMSLAFGDNYETATTITANYQFRKLFSAATEITSAENMVLPSTAVTSQCYSQMFQGCTSLTTTPKQLPCLTMGNYCYSDMFHGCTALVNVPSDFLPATTLYEGCYWYMFQGCTSLTTAPQLLATTLANRCYGGLFNGCSSLSSIKCLATNISAIRSTYDWVNGVSSTGTFTKAASMTAWTSGDSGIPNNWTVVDYSG